MSSRTSIDHQQWLGDTLEKIAAEKAGIIKPGVPVITAADEPEALAVIEKTAREKNAPLIKVGRRPPVSYPRSSGSRDGVPVLPLPGDHQQFNAALALATVEALQDKIPVSDPAIRTGLETVNGRGGCNWSKSPSGQKILLDGAHNVAGAKVLRQALEKYFGEPRRMLVLGVLQDKDWRQICETLAPLAVRILTVPVSSERTADARELAAACRAVNPTAEIVACDSLREALEKIAGDDFVVVTGSLYLVGEALESFGLSPATGDERALNEWGTHSESLSTTVS